MDDGRRRGLGRGLSALLSEGGDSTPPAETARGGTRSLGIDLLAPNPHQPRRHFDDEALAELADSIREKGLIQPILVRPRADSPGRYEIVAGERRWRAAQRAGLHEVPVVVRELGDAEALELALIENVQRTDLNPIEEAAGYAGLLERFGHRQEDLARLIGKSRSHIANTLRLLTLPEAVRARVVVGSLTAGHARALVGSPDPESLAETVVEKGLTVRQTEELARQVARPHTAGRRAEKDADTRALEQSLSAALGLSVSIRPNGARGEVRITYRDFDDLDEVCRRLCAASDAAL
jgi:ParB family chromosome partitioning protein